MAAENAHLALYLDAPLQSWGYQSRFDRRSTLSYPTRSGIVGMLAAAMGIDRSDTERLADFAGLEMAVYTLRRQGRIVDFHTVGGGWDKKRHPQNVVRTASDTPGNTVVTRREYLQNARFGVVISGCREHVQSIQSALHDPRWGIWLGRKSCIPATPVVQGIFDNPDGALAHLCELAGCERPTRTVTEAETFEQGSDTLMDTPLDFATRDFAPRRVSVE